MPVTRLRALLAAAVAVVTATAALPATASSDAPPFDYDAYRPEQAVGADVPATVPDGAPPGRRTARIRTATAEASGYFGACGAVSLADDSFTDPSPILEVGDRLVVPVLDGATSLALLALDQLGRRDTSYGDRGTVDVPLPGSGDVRVVAEGDTVTVLSTVPGEDGGDLWLRRVVGDGTVAEARTVDIGEDDELRDAVSTANGVVAFVATADLGVVAARLVGGALDAGYGLTALPVDVRVAAAGPGGVVGFEPFSADLVRLRADGTADPGFGTGGVATSPLGASTAALAVGPDGLVWAAGVDGGKVAVGRLGADGTGGPGLVRLNAAFDGFGGIAIGVGGDGRAVVAADLAAGDAMELAQAVFRLRPDLAVDASFGNGGRLDWTTQFPDVVTTVRPAADGPVLVQSGHTVRRLRDGQLDGPCPPDDVGAVRFAGANRYATAAALSRTAFPRAEVVYLATGEQFPDALAGGPAAAVDRAPLLLTRRTELPDETRAELDRLRPDRIVVLGGKATITDQVVDAVRPYGSPVRQAGGNRYETAAAVSAATFPPGVDRVYLATGEAFPDALAVGPFAGARQVPILLTHPNLLPDETRAELDRLAPREIVVVGGPAAVSDGVRDRLADRYPGATMHTVAGADRFNTARQLLLFEGYDGGYPSLEGPLFDIVHLATGLSFPDALAAGPVAAMEGGALLLTAPNELSETARDAFSIAAPQRVNVLGGTAAVATAVSDRLTASELGHRFLAYAPTGAPLGWNRCAPVAWVFNPKDAPSGAEAMLQQAFARIEQATGIDFVYQGTVDEPLPDPATGAERPPFDYERQRYGDAWSPVLVGWGTPFLTGAVGEATAQAVTDDGFVSGTIVFDRRVSFPVDFSEVSWGMVALHEIGHVVGLDHVPTPRVMYPAIGRHPLTDLTPADRLGLQRATGPGCRPTPARPSQLMR